MSSGLPPGKRSGEPRGSEPLSEWIQSHETAASPSSTPKSRRHGRGRLGARRGGPERGGQFAVRLDRGRHPGRVVLRRAHARGLLRLVATLFCLFSLVEAPLTLDVSAWYAPRSLPVLLAIAAVAVYGFRVSIAGKPAFGRWIED